MQNLNKYILNYLNSLIESDFWFNFSWLFSDGPIFFLPIFLVYFWIFWTFKKQIEKKKDLLFIFFSTFFAISWNLIFQRFFSFKRPEESWVCSETWKLIIDHLPDASFPSDHAVVSFAFLFSIYLAWYRKTFFVFLPFVIFMNLSRIMVCVHWPFDILVWSILWIFWAFFTFRFIKKLKIFDKLNDFILKISSFFKL